MDYAVRNIFLQSISGQGTLPLFPGDYCGNTLVLEPSEQTPELGADNPGILKGRKQHLDCIQNDPICINRINGTLKTDK